VISDTIESMSNKTRVAANTISQIIGKGVSGIISFVISIILAKALGVDGYGDFTKIITYVAFFYLFCDFGLNAAYLQKVSERSSETLPHSLFTLRVLIGLILMFVTMALLVFLPGTSTQGYSGIVKMGIILFIPSILCQSLITTTNVYFQERLRYAHATIALITGSLVTLLLVYVSSLIFSSTMFLFSFVIANLFGLATTAAVAILLVKKTIVPLRLVWNPKEMKQLFLLAIPLGVTLVFNVIYFHADSFILTVSRPTAEVGIYGLAYKFFEFTLVIPTFFMNAALPLLMKTFSQNASSVFRARIMKSALLLLLTSIGIAIAGWCASPLLTYIRPEFAISSVPLKILLLGLPFFYLSNITMWVLVIKKLRIQLLLIYGISMLVNIGLNMYFIPLYGYIAAAWITGISELCIVISSYLTIVAVDKK
jgi:O-antigen/teichoic acid export membrane protein